MGTSSLTFWDTCFRIIGRYKNYSAPEDKPLVSSNSYVSEIKLKKEIDNKIRYAQCVLIIGGMYAKRTWMKYELESARSMGKPIIVVAPTVLIF